MVYVTTRACVGRFQEISNYLEYLPGFDLNVPCTKGDFIYILNQLVPIQWCRHMICIITQLFNKYMAKVIKHMEKMEVLEVIIKQQGTKKDDKDGSEDKTVKSKMRLRNFTRKILSLKARRKKEVTLTLMTTGTIRNLQSVIPKVGHSELTLLMTV